MWQQCLKYLEQELSPQQFNTWIRPLQADIRNDYLILFAPNQFVMDWVNQHHLDQIKSYIGATGIGNPDKIKVIVGSKQEALTSQNKPAKVAKKSQYQQINVPFQSNTNANFTFKSFIEGKSNQLARAAALQIGENPGAIYNPLFIYGGVGLGKTHLMHAVGNQILINNRSAKVLYINSEGFVSEMVKALRYNKMDAFKRRFRTVNALLIDDIQFFSGKERSQEEFFHTFNTLFESQQQIILSSDRYPKEVENVEDRLRSRFGWGLTVSVEAPDLETRVAIIQSKAQYLFNSELTTEVAFFIANQIRSNVRELEGAVRRIFASAEFMKGIITLDFVENILRDLIATNDKVISIINIQKAVADYFGIQKNDLISSSRSRIFTRPRQIAMALTKELTNYSLPEIGRAFGGRNHTTVLHATRKINELCETEVKVANDYQILLQKLSG